MGSMSCDVAALAAAVRVSGRFRLAPPRKRLVAEYGREVGLRLDGIIRRGVPDDLAGFPSTADWVSKCYHYPRRREVIMSCLDEAAGTYGVEAIPAGASSDAGFAAEYLNTGDTYCRTLLYDYSNGRLYLTSWGCWLEAAERSGRVRSS